jgi:hypothetical protein
MALHWIVTIDTDRKQWVYGVRASNKDDAIEAGKTFAREDGWAIGDTALAVTAERD